MCLGVDAFAAQLRAAGYDANAYEDILGHFVAVRIERDYASNARHQPLVLVGYSSGAVTAVAIARRLNRSHIPVDLLVTLDPALPEVVPGNVRVCLNYYERIIPGLPLLSGTMMKAEKPVTLQNVRLKQSNHLTIDESPEMKTAVTARIAILSATANTRANSAATITGSPARERSAHLGRGAWHD